MQLSLCSENAGHLSRSRTATEADAENSPLMENVDARKEIQGEVQGEVQENSEVQSSQEKFQDEIQIDQRDQEQGRLRAGDIG